MATANPAEALFILKYGSHRVLVAPPLDHDTLQQSIRRHFPEIPLNHRVSYYTKDLQIARGTFVEISPDVWHTVIPMLNKLTVRTVDEQGDSECWSCDEESIVSPRPVALAIRGTTSTPASRIASTSNSLTITIVTKTGRRIQVQAFPSDAVSGIKEKIQNREGIPPDQQRLLWDGRQLQDSWMLGDVGITSDVTVYLVLRLTGGKPVIYLLPPSGIDVEAVVKLSLVPEWKFDAVYPVVPTTTSSAGVQAIQWNVKASPDGTLLEKSTGLEVSYLFWEAEALKGHKEPLSPLPSPTEECTSFELDPTFIPNQPQIDPTNSVVLDVSKVTPYLDTVLQSFGLHTEARTSFITYWLPAFLKHEYVAMRFPSQVAYEKAAPLEVSPTPDVIVRIFMLFKGLKEEDVQGNWGAAVDTMDWKTVVGLGERSLADDSLFRVVEWGGMEVL